MNSHLCFCLLSILLFPLFSRAANTTAEPDLSEDEIVRLKTMQVVDDSVKEASTHTEYFDLTSERKVDLLFVMDASKSMKEEQQLVANAIGRYIESFATKNLDFHLGVIEMKSGKGKLRSFRKWEMPYLTKDSLNYIAEFKRAILVGTSGTNAETAFIPIIASLTNPDNQDFYRDDALLSIVIISDEDESFGGNNARYLREDAKASAQRMADLHTALLTKKGVKKGLFRLDVVTAPNPIPAGCQTKIAGTTLIDAASKLGGRAINLCEDFSNDLIAVADEISTVAQRRFSLQYLPIVPTIKVQIKDRVIPADAKNGWSLDFDANAIYLHGQALQDSFGSNVTIFYKWLPKPEETTP